MLGTPAEGAERWVRVSAKGKCVSTHPPGHRIEMVHEELNRRDSVAEAEDRARARATAALRSSACAGLPDRACDAIMQRSAMNVAISVEQGLVCAAVLVPSQAVADPLGHTAHEKQLEALVAKIAQSSTTESVRSVEARSSAGCGLGEAGARLASSIRGGLTQRGIAISDAGLTSISVEVAGGDPAVVEVWSAGPNTPRAMIASARLAASWLGVGPSDLNRCVGGEAMGVLGGGRPGKTGATVQLTLDAEGPLCGGDPAVRAVARPTAAAAMQVWTVKQTGEALLLWSEHVDSKSPIERQRVVLDLAPEYSPDAGEETLLALAAPTIEDLPKGRPGCVLERLTQTAWTPAVAVATMPFRVDAPGVGRCPAATATGASGPAEPPPKCQ
jgi:hypothetical protein